MEYLNIEIREMVPSDLAAVMEIENLCFISPWSKTDLENEMNDKQFKNVWVIELSFQGAKIIGGFCIYYQTFSSGTIAQIAVHPSLQHRQLGTAMMDEIINDAYAKKIECLTLEVRENNIHAINFYLKNGFEKILVKKNYYSNGDNAIYMIRKMDLTK